MREQNYYLMLRQKTLPTLLATSVLLTLIFRGSIVQAETTDSMLVYKSAACGCCATWVKHMNEAGINSIVKDTENLAVVKDSLNIASKNQACHSAVLQGYVFEGHIPANVIQHFLTDKPEGALGLAVPGMPLGSPGMDNGKAFSPYTVFQLNKDGSRAAYATVSLKRTVFVEKKL